MEQSIICLLAVNGMNLLYQEELFMIELGIRTV